MRNWQTAIVVALTIMLASSSCAEPSPTATPSSPSTTAPPEDKEGLAILSHSSYVDSFGYFHLVGEVENVGSQNTELNKVTITFFDNEGKAVATASIYTYLDILKPGQKSPFEIIFSAPPPVANYKLESTWQITSREPYTDLNIEGITFERGDQGGNLSGQISNTGSETADVIIIVGTFYDSNEKVVGVIFSFPEILPLKSGQSSSFAMIVEPQVASAMETYAVQAEGYVGA